MSYDDPYGASMGGGGQRSGSKRSGGGGQRGKPEGYIEVNERVVEFHSLFPEGVIWTEIVDQIGLVIGDDVPRICVKAYARRRPGEDPFTGLSWLEVPGGTPYTKGSEIENAETSAVGRALAFMGIAAKEGIATLEEILSKQVDTRPQPSASSEPEDADTSQSPPADPPAKEDTTETLPEDTTAETNKPKRKSRAKAKAKADPVPAPEQDTAVDQQTGEITGLSKEEFHQRMRDELIPRGSVVPIFERLYPGQDPTMATGEQRMAVLQAAIAEREAAG